MTDCLLEYIRIDACLDRGGSWSYTNRECSTELTVPSTLPSTVPIASYPVRRYRFLTLVVFIMLIAVTVVLRLATKTSHPPADSSARDEQAI